MSDTERLEEAAALLRENGYLVSRVTECHREGGHGRHTLNTRSEVCPGREPMPHGFRGGRFGTFDYWVSCKCGSDFADNDDYEHSWTAHKAEHRIADAVLGVPASPKEQS